MKLDPDDIIAMVICVLLVISIMEMFCWAITGAFIGK